MSQYTVHHAIPYPEGLDRVAVHADLEALAVKTDAELNTTHRAAEQALENSVPPIVRNLFDYEDTVYGTLGSGGSIIDHSSNRVSNFIPVTPGEPYVSWSDRLTRVVFFDADQNSLSGTNTSQLPGGQQYQHMAPTNARFVRVGVHPIAGNPTPPVIFNRGTRLWEPNENTESGWWNERELPPNRKVTVDDLDFSRNGKISSDMVDGSVPPKVMNLYDPHDTINGTLGSGGSIIDHSTNRVSGFIPVTAGAEYSFYHIRLGRVLFFDANENVVSDHSEWLDSAVHHIFVAPHNAVTARLGLSFIAGDDYLQTPTVFNVGSVLWEPGKNITTGWWDDRELPPGVGEAGVHEDQVRRIVDTMLPHWEPSFPTLQFETVYTGTNRPLWLDTTGEMLYGRAGSTLLQSNDEWETRETIHQFPIFINGIRTLNDGELLVATARGNTTGLQATLHKSSGYDPTNPTTATWSEVLVSPAADANFGNAWGLQVYQNIVIAGEYGLRGEEGSRRVWMSEDHGTTWTLVFDLKTVDAAGRPPWNEQAHVHTPAWDPYWSRLWVVTGDSNNTATYYSDDKGETWTFVEDSGTVQFTGIMPLPDTVIFGSDAAPNGVHVYRRGKKTDMPIIEPLLVVNDRPTLTHVFMLPYKRDWGPTTPTYFAAQPASSQQPGSLVVATVDGRKAHQLWEGNRPDSDLPASGNLPTVLGPTSQGNIIAAMSGDPEAPDGRVLKAPAPMWEKI